MIYLILIYEFFKIGLFAAGGGLATLPFLSALADKYEWLTSDMISQMVALSESTPGPLGINMATYAGYMAGFNTFGGSELMGVTTAFTATASLVAPSFIVILIVSRVLDKYKNSSIVDSAFSTLRPAVAGLIAAAAWSVIGTTLFNFTASTFGAAFCLPETALFAVMMVLTNLKPLKKLHPLVFIAIAAAAGMVIGFTVGW
ncbi:MAG: chromate transporter [Clostridia bacterium]|nr:chromate transporter [Clostridia bacterium]